MSILIAQRKGSPPCCNLTRDPTTSCITGPGGPPREPSPEKDQLLTSRSSSGSTCVRGVSESSGHVGCAVESGTDFPHCAAPCRLPGRVWGAALLATRARGCPGWHSVSSSAQRRGRACNFGNPAQMGSPSGCPGSLWSLPPGEEVGQRSLPRGGQGCELVSGL